MRDGWAAADAQLQDEKAASRTPVTAPVAGEDQFADLDVDWPALSGGVSEVQ